MKTDREIVWRPYVWSQPRPAESHEIAALEQAWGVVLPQAYKDLVSRYQGMIPTPNVFNVGSSYENVVCELLTVTRDEEKDGYYALEIYDVLKPHVPSGIYPFASTPGGEPLCFDYRDNPAEPAIVLVSVESDIYRVADSFNDFLSMLHD